MNPTQQDVSASLWIGGIALALSVLSCVMWLGVALAADTTHADIGSCVVHTARQQGHPDPYGKQAWELFADTCR